GPARRRCRRVDRGDERGRGCAARRRRSPARGSALALRRVGRRHARRDAPLARRPRAPRPRRARRGARRRPAERRVRLTSFLFLATLFFVTWEKVHWNVGADVSISDILTILFLLAFALEWWGRGERRYPKTTAIVLVVFAVLLVIYLIGFFNIQTTDSLTQWAKGMVKFVLHFLFLAAAVAYLVRRSRAYYWRALAVFTLGLAANCVYGVLQLLAARAGVNLDHVVLSPLTGGASSINIYGVIGNTNVSRPDALTGDPNHLGIMLCVPLLALLPVYLRLERGNRLRWPLAILLAFFFLVQLATLSRSGLLGLAVGLLIL